MNTARCQRSVLGARNMSIKVPVSIIIDHAACRTHQYYTRYKDEQNLKIRLTLAGNQQGPECRPQQQENPDWPVKPHQPDVILNMVGT